MRYENSNQHLKTEDYLYTNLENCQNKNKIYAKISTWKEELNLCWISKEIDRAKIISLTNFNYSIINEVVELIIVKLKKKAVNSFLGWTKKMNSGALMCFAIIRIEFELWI